MDPKGEKPLLKTAGMTRGPDHREQNSWELHAFVIIFTFSLKSKAVGKDTCPDHTRNSLAEERNGYLLLLLLLALDE